MMVNGMEEPVVGGLRWMVVGVFALYVIPVAFGISAALLQSWRERPGKAACRSEETRQLYGGELE
jgi:hypothetical protein